MGRPDQVQLIFHRRVTKRTPGRFRTRVLTEGVTPSLLVDDKHSKIKPHHKEGRALRTETTINDPRDFGIGKRLFVGRSRSRTRSRKCGSGSGPSVSRNDNLFTLRKVGFDANRRLLNVQRISHDAILGEAEFQRLNSSVERGSQRAGPLRLGDAKVQTLLSVLLFRLLVRGFAARDLREHWVPLLGTTPDSLTSSPMTYQLRRLRLHGLIERIPKSHRYQLAATKIRTIDNYIQIYNRILKPEFAAIARSTPSAKT